MRPPAAIVRVPLRWVDLDAQGHVNNAVYWETLEECTPVADGAVVEQGTHDDLLRRGGRYAALVAAGGVGPAAEGAPVALAA